MVELLPTESSTSLQRTYRYLRIGIAGSMIIVAVSVIVASVQIGEVLPSISAYYYTPAQSALVGALVAAGIGILALSGRGVERRLLDAAGLFPPLIAFVPTPVAPGTIPGVNRPCPSGVAQCIPSAVLPTVQNDVITYVVVGLLLVAVAVTIAIAKKRLGDPAILFSILVALVVILAVAATGIWFDALLLQWGHLVFAGAFFLLIAAVAFRNVWPFAGEDKRSRRVQVTFCVIGIAMTVDVLGLAVTAAILPDTGHLVIIGESVALALFMVLWVLESGRKLHSVDPGKRSLSEASGSVDAPQFLELGGEVRRSVPDA